MSSLDLNQAFLMQTQKVVSKNFAQIFIIVFNQHNNSMEAESKHIHNSESVKAEHDSIEPKAAVAAMKVNYDAKGTSLTGEAKGPFDQEIRKILKIQNDEVLLNLVRRSLQDQTPYPIGSIYYKDPTHYGNSFSQLDITPLHPQYKPIKFELYDIKTKPVFMDESFVHNNTPQPLDFEASLSVQVSNTTQTTWTKELSVGVGYSISTSINVVFVSAEANISTNIQTTFGKAQTLSSTITIEKTLASKVVVPPGRKYMARLDASLGTAKAKITYEVELKGHFMATISGRLNAVPHSGNIQELLPLENMKTIIDQNLDISTYSRGTISVWDVTDGNAIEVEVYRESQEQK